MDTYVIGFRYNSNPRTDEAIRDYFVRLSAPDNKHAFGALAETVQLDIDGEYDGNLSEILHEFAAEWPRSTIHLNHTPDSDHTVHIYDVDTMMVMILNSYRGPEDRLDTKVTFTATDFVQRYSH